MYFEIKIENTIMHIKFIKKIKPLGKYSFPLFLFYLNIFKYCAKG